MSTFITEAVGLDTFAQTMESQFINTETEFQMCETNTERINLFLRKEEVMQVVQNCLNQMDGFVQKSNTISRELNLQGNNYFDADKHLLAVEKYTQSVCSARTDFSAGLAYGHRALVLFAMGLYNECIIDIHRTLKHGHPKDENIELFLRRAKAKRKVPEFLTNTCKILETEKNRFVQSARSCIQIGSREKYGKYIFAIRDIEIGEVLIVEEPYASIVINDKNYYCHGCLKCCYNLIPCRNCCFVRYCSRTCRKKVYRSYHKYECLIQHYIYNLFHGFKDSLMFALRMTLLARYSGDNCPNDNIYRSDRYYEISRLESHSDKYPIKHLFVLSYMTSAVFYILKKKTNIFSECENYEEKFKEQFLLNLQISSIHRTEINHSYKKYDSDTGIYGSGIYSLGSLFKHSCYPNAFAYTSGTTFVVRTFSKIKRGEECFVSYNNHCLSVDKTTRQLVLQNMYHFTCKCIACTENWPIKKDCEVEESFLVVAKKLAGTNGRKLMVHLENLSLELREIVETMTEPSDAVFEIRERIRIGYHILDDIF